MSKVTRSPDYVMWLIVVGFLLLLTGCASAPKSNPPEVKYILIEPGAELLVDCKKSRPVDRRVFMAADKDERIVLLSKMDIQHQNDVDVCNERFKSLREYYAEQRRIRTNKPD